MLDAGSTASINSSQSQRQLHRRRTLYLVRHGEAIHNVKEAQAQEKAKRQAEELGLSTTETEQRMEEARKKVLQDKTLFDAPLTDLGRQQAQQAGLRLAQLIHHDRIAPPPTEAMVSPLGRCLETAEIILQQRPPRPRGQINESPLQVHIRPEIRERQTQYPPDTHKEMDKLLHWTMQRYSHKDKDDEKDIDFCFHVTEQALQGHDLEVEESRTMLRQRASQLFDVLMEMKHRHILIVSHKGYLREMERGLLGLEDSPLFDNAEVRVYRVVFTKGDRALSSVERLA